MGKMELSKCEKEVMEILYSAEMELNMQQSQMESRHLKSERMIEGLKLET